MCLNYFDDFKIDLNTSTIPLVTRFKYLGFWIQNDLKFDFQADTLLKKLSFCNLSLSRASRFLNYESLLLLYKSFHLSYVLYYKYVLRFIGKCKTRKISSKLIGAASDILHCSKNSVFDEIFNFDYILNFYTYLFIFRILQNKEDKMILCLIKLAQHPYYTETVSLYSLTLSKI